MTFFEDHYVDEFGRDPAGAVKKLLQDGVITFDCDSREAYHRAVAGMGSVVFHRDSDQDGVTAVEYREDLVAVPGYSAMTADPLRPHTDSSGIATVPRGLSLLCESAAGQGGDAILVDGLAVADLLKKQNRAAYESLSRPQSAIFVSGGEIYRGQVFSENGHGDIRVRLRTDGLGYFSYEVVPHLLALNQAICLCASVLKLAPGQGYAIDNSRYLHGRQAFNGSRRMLRLLFDPHDEGVETGPPDRI